MNQKTLEAFHMLGLRSGASPEEAKAAYRKLAREYHPDKVASLGEELRSLALKKMKEINEAYKLLEQLYEELSQSQDQEEASHTDSATEDSANSQSRGGIDFSKIDIFEERRIDDRSEIEMLRASVSQWAASIPHHDLTDLGSSMEIVSAFSRPAYYISIQSQFESRALRQGHDPSTNIRTRDLLKDSKVNVWTLPVPSFSLFKNFSEKYRIDESAITDLCSECAGGQSLSCGACVGRGRQPCNWCEGNGKQQCEECQGGIIKCGHCSGRGQVEVQLSSTYNYRRAMQNCSYCAGRGHGLCSACIQGFKTCQYCSGTGILECLVCFGAGRVKCGGCQGYGSITAYLYIDQQIDIRTGAKKIIYPAMCETFFKSFSNSFEKKLRQEAEQIYGKTRLKWSGNDFDGLRSDRLKKAAVALLVEASAQEKQRSPHAGSHILQQKLTIFQENITCIEYRYRDTSYKLYVYGKSGSVWSENSPIHSVEKSRIAEAETLFKKKKYSEAADLTRKAMAMSPSNKRHPAFLKQILKEIKKDYLWGGAVGGTLTIPFIGTLLGVGVGNILNRVFSDKVKTGKKRFFLSFGITMILDLLVAAFILFAIWMCLVTMELSEVGGRLKNYNIRKTQIESFGSVGPQMMPEYEWLKRNQIKDSILFEGVHKKVAWLGIPSSPFAVEPTFGAERMPESERD